MPLKHSGKKISDMIRDLEKFKQQLPSKVGTIAVNFFQENFDKSGFQGDNGLEAWPKRSGKEKGKDRKLLVKSGRLRRSIQKKVWAGGVRVYVGSPADEYADVHNFGFDGSVQVKEHSRRRFKKERVGFSNLASKKRRSKTIRYETGESSTVSSHTRKMSVKQRKFIGNSRQLDAKIKQVIIDGLKEALNGK